MVLLLTMRLLGWRVLHLRCLLSIAPLAAPANVDVVVTAGNAAYLLERTTSSTSSLEGALELMDPTLCLVQIIVTIEHQRQKMKKPLQKRRTVLRCCRYNWSLLSYHWWYLWVGWCCLRGRWWLLLCCHLCKLLTYCRHQLVLLERGWKPLLLLPHSLLQLDALRQLNTRLLELLRLSINRHVLGCNRLIRLGVLMLHQLSNLPASTWRPPAPTKDPTIGTTAYGPEDPEGLTD
ncbi:hypothetical protein Taro_047081 [Colocasia esculenta]|uniref:Secreted protein n=1 Tax=Colocasia esculenta TaxID=4460 RepID=A0A843X3C0_COLES|nr:hypothetical protein [Colocasia esculenta]